MVALSASTPARTWKAGGGIVTGSMGRIAAGAKLFAFGHGLAAGTAVRRPN